MGLMIQRLVSNSLYSDKTFSLVCPNCKIKKYIYYIREVIGRVIRH